MRLVAGAVAAGLGYRLRLDPAAGGLPGVHVRVLDGDRALEARVEPGVELLVLGELREPLIRIAGDSVRVNASSPTAQADVVGAVAAAVALSSPPVFRHGVVISALPATGARLACAAALVCGLGAAALSFLPEFDEPTGGTR